MLTTPPRISRLGLLTLTAITGTVYAGTIHVPGDFQSLNDAVQAAQSGDEIIVAAGEHPAGIRISKAITVRSEQPHGDKLTSLCVRQRYPLRISH